MTIIVKPASVLLMLLLLTVLLFSATFQTCHAKRNHGHKKHHHHHHHHHNNQKNHRNQSWKSPALEPKPPASEPKPKPEPKPPASEPKPPASEPKPKPKPEPKPPASEPKPKPEPKPEAPASGKNIFNVLDFGAKGDGKRDDSKAFLATWEKACKGKESKILVPSKSTFLVGPISFNGRSCQPNIVFQVDGIIMAPTSKKSWGSSGLLQWINFRHHKGITIQGNGTIEGQGGAWWRKSSMPHAKPTALRFYGSSGVTVTGIKMQNSPKCHLKFDDCDGVDVHAVTVTSPGDSPNTDGIHLQNSKNVLLHHNKLSCGDDCISIQTGCRNIHIHHVNCGPGHGISIGGLGKDNSKACVSNVTVENVVLRGTMTGVRIKTWQGGSGSVRNVKFSNIDVSEVKVPIMINQFYCDKKKPCKIQNKGVAVSGISYENIKGTFTKEPIHLACSKSVPCLGLTLSAIDLQPSKGAKKTIPPFCSNSYGLSYSPIDQPLDCLQMGKPPKDNLTEPDLGSC